jgi:hypothetical protein
MNTEASSEFEAHYYDRVGKIGAAAAAAIGQLDQLHSTGPTPRKTLDAEVARIAQETLHPYGCDLVVHRTAGGLTRFLIEVQSTGKRYDLIKRFCHRDVQS